jgi:hypothetical protein
VWFIGVWISFDQVDTLDFETDEDFYKSNIYMRHHHYKYYYMEDSITINYSGINYINVLPSSHIYEIKDNILTIDFTNGCYGFDRVEKTFSRQ